MKQFTQSACRVILLLMIISLSCSPHEKQWTVPQESEQLIVVVTPSFDAVQGSLYRFEKQHGWTAISPAFDVVVGRKGMAWGRGIHPEPPADHPVKREGDGRSPAGIFSLPCALGLAPPERLAPLNIAYEQISESTECVDDAESVHYNETVDRDTLQSIDYTSSEPLSAFTAQMRYALFVEHNVSPRAKSAGSCIFLHVWKRSDRGTLGCTAMSASHMKAILEWIDAARNPLLIQLPESEYHRVKARWGLPALPGTNNL
jgi:D-alanyl-D-alanine dipeptidase